MVPFSGSKHDIGHVYLVKDKEELCKHMGIQTATTTKKTAPGQSSTFDKNVTAGDIVNTNEVWIAAWYVYHSQEGWKKEIQHLIIKTVHDSLIVHALKHKTCEYDQVVPLEFIKQARASIIAINTMEINKLIRYQDKLPDLDGKCKSRK